MADLNAQDSQPEFLQESIVEDEPEPDPEVEALLDEGYERLDEFVAWLEQYMGVDTRVAQQHCFNAEALVDYLANHARKCVADVNEFDLRWFVFSHYIRKANADAETEERLIDSLRLYAMYLRTERGEDLPDCTLTVLNPEERERYLERRHAYHELDQESEARWMQGFRAWCAELEHDLDNRGLWLPTDMGDGMAWGDVTGWREAALRQEAHSAWLAERAEMLELGIDPDTIRDRLDTSYRVWLDTPQEKLDGDTPREVILAEREERKDI